MGYIYKIEGPLNIKEKTKMYIGQTRESLNKRWNRHKSDLRKFDSTKKKRFCYYLCAAMRKYNVENFTISIVETCDDELLNEKEEYYIKEFNTLAPNGYNLQSGGKVITHHPDTIKKISENTSKGIRKNIDNYRKYDVCDGLPVYISYYIRKNKGAPTRHGYNVFHKPSGKRKSFTVPINAPLNNYILKQAIDALEILKRDYEIVKYNMVIKEFAERMQFND